MSLYPNVHDRAIEEGREKGYEEGKREGRRLGWLEAAEELMVSALQLQKLGLNRDHDVIKACADHLREKSDKLP